MTLLASLALVAQDKASEKGPLSDLLRFENGDNLHGNLKVIKEGDIVWSRPDVKGPIQTEIKALEGIKLHNNASQATTGSRITLSNKDVFYGDIIGMTEEELHVNTEFAGKVSIPKVMVKSILPSASSGKAIMQSIGDLSTWKKSGTWRKENGKTVISSGSFSKQLDLPDKIHIKADISWNGSYPRFNIIAYTNDINNFYREGYGFRFSNTSSFYIYRGNSSSITSASCNLRHKQNVKLDVYINRKESTASVYVSGKKLRDFNLSFTPTGKHLVIYCDGSYGQTTFNELKVLNWNGELPANTSSTQEKQPEDVVRFINNDRMSGKIIKIENGMLELKTAFAQLKAPVNKIKSMTFSDEDSERARRNKNDVEVYFPNGDYITLDLKEIKDGKIYGKSENYGEKAFNLNAFIGIRFKLYQEGNDSNHDFKNFIMK